MNKAYFRGMPSGIYFDNDGNLINRVKLVTDSFKHQDVIKAHFNDFNTNLNYWGESSNKLNTYLPEGAVDHVTEELCEVMSKYKYLIIIDGNAASWPVHRKF